MNEQVALSLLAGAMTTAAKIAGPILLAAMLVGLVVSLFQSVTQIQELTLTFVPKLLVIGLIVALAGHWMIGQMVAYVDQLYGKIPQLIAGA